MGPVRETRAGDPTLAEQQLLVEHGRASSRRRSPAIRPSEPGPVLDCRGARRRRGPEEVEPPAGLLHLSRRPADPERRLEPSPHDGRAQQARTHRDRRSARARRLFQINVAKMRVVLPDEIRPQLRSLAAGVVTAAQEAYRRRLHLVSASEDLMEPHPAGPQDDSADRSIGAVWPLIVEVVARELREHPELLDRVLLALANAQQIAVSQAARSA